MDAGDEPWVHVGWVAQPFGEVGEPETAAGRGGTHALGDAVTASTRVISCLLLTIALSDSIVTPACMVTGRLRSACAVTADHGTLGRCGRDCVSRRGEGHRP